MNFVNMQELYRDMERWERELPQFDAVCGVPRSGMIPAAYIAIRRNIRLVEITDLLRQPDGAIGRAPMRKTNPIMRDNRPCGNRLLIVDDASSVNSVTFRDLQKRLQDQTSLDISYGAVYRASSASVVDHYFREVPHPRMFGWNWYRHWWMRQGLCDLDGVLCEDWTGPSEQDNDPVFMAHMKNAKPLYIPDVPVQAVVTSRLERYRDITKGWLREHGVSYDRLVMHPAATPEDRRSANDHARRKAAEYERDSKSTIFIESDVRQATAIHQITGKPVLCTDTMRMISKASEA